MKAEERSMTFGLVLAYGQDSITADDYYSRATTWNSWGDHDKQTDQTTNSTRYGVGYRLDASARADSLQQQQNQRHDGPRNDSDC